MCFCGGTFILWTGGLHVFLRICVFVAELLYYGAEYVTFKIKPQIRQKKWFHCRTCFPLTFPISISTWFPITLFFIIIIITLSLSVILSPFIFISPTLYGSCLTEKITTLTHTQTQAPLVLTHTHTLPFT